MHRPIPQPEGNPESTERFIGACPFCRSKYDIEDSDILESSGENYLLHIECSKCRSSIISFVFQGPVGASAMGFVTDLTRDDVVKFQKKSRLELNELIDLHFYLEKLGTGQKINKEVG